MSTAYIDTPTPAPLRGPLLVLALELAYGRGVSPRIGDVPAHQCEWCAEVNAVTILRVYGQPRADVLHPVEVEEVCGMCGPTVIARARSEARDDAGDIVVEVAA